MSGQAARTDLASYLPGDLLAKVDTASMANSLEVRTPYLDHEVVGLALRIPARLKRAGLHGKKILRKTFADLVPAAVLHRRKMGFAVPMGRWLRTELNAYMRETLLAGDARVLKHFKAEGLMRMVDEHVVGGVDHAAGLYALMMLELWHRECGN